MTSEPNNDSESISNETESIYPPESSINTSTSQPNTPVPETSTSKKRKAEEIQKYVNDKLYKLADADGEESFIKLVLDNRNRPINFYCSICSKFFSMKKGGSFYSHVEKCKSTMRPEVLPAAKVSEENKVAFRQLMVQSASKDLMPFSFYVSQSLRNIVQASMNIAYKSKSEGNGPPNAGDIMCSRRTLTRQLYQDVAQNKEELFSYIRNNVKANGGSITVDMTSKKKHFVGTVFHFIDKEWVMKTFPFDIHEFSVNSTADNIKEDCKKLLESIDLDINDLFIVTDEGSNVVAALGYDHQHILCACHVLHTVCKRSLDPYKAAYVFIDLPESVRNDLARINAVVKTLKTVVNAVRVRLILRNELSYSLLVDCDTRWMTKLKMIRQFQKLSPDDLELIENTFKNDNKNDLLDALKDTIRDRDILELVVEVFTPFETAIRTLEAEKTPTLNLVLPTINDLETRLQFAAESDDHLKSSLGKSALSVLNYKKKKLITTTHAFALILDPLNMRKLAKNSNFKTYKDNFEEKVKLMAGGTIVETEDDENSNPFIDNAEASRPDYEEELLRYYKEKPSPEDYDLLTWWKKNEVKYPLLSKLASEVLCIPASSASIERLFSTLNLMTPAERSNLCNETLKNLVLHRAIDLFKK